MPDLKKMLTLEALSEALPSWLKRSTKPEYNADEIDSTLTTNQFVTATDKDNWNAKGTYSKPSGGIPKSDLSSIVQTSLEKADSALQSETDPTVPSWAKQTNKPSYTQDEVADGTTYKRVTQTEKNTWSGKQNALTTTQMQAVNSGITSEKVTQINTNQLLEAEDRAALAEVVDGGAKNELQPTWTTQTINGVTFTVGSDGVITVTTTGTRTSAAIYPLLSRYSGAKMTGKVMSISPKGGTDASYYVSAEQADNPWHNVGTDYGDGVVISSEANNRDINVNIVIPANYSPNNLKFSPMICTLADWKVSQKFVPYDTRQWRYMEKRFTSTVADTYEYSGVSFDVPANQVYEFYAIDRKEGAEAKGILVADNSTNVVTPVEKTTIAENNQTYTTDALRVWQREVSGLTGKYHTNLTYYVWVKRGAAAANTIVLAYRRIY